MEKVGISLASLLRMKAEMLIKNRPDQVASITDEGDILKLLHELEEYSVELEMQNEALLNISANADALLLKNKSSENIKHRLIHEFELNQIELEIQNEELILTTAISQDVTERYSELFNFSTAGYLILSKEGDILDLNFSGARLLGKNRLKLKNSRFGFFVSEYDLPIYNDFLSDLFKQKSKITCEVSLQLEDNRSIIVLLSGILIKNQEQCLITILDITERKLASKYRELTREILQILNEPGDIKEMLHHTLQILKMRTGLDAIGIRLKEGDDFPYLEQSGFTTDFLLTENSLIELDKRGKACRDKNGNVRLACTCGMVISGNFDTASPSVTEGGSWWTNDAEPILDIPANKDIRYHPRNHCIYQGYSSLSLIPIRNNGNIIGLIQFNDKRKGAFNLIKVESLEGIASHIGAALMRKQAEETLRKNEELLRSITTNAPDIIIQLDRKGTILYMNRPFPGFTLDESIGKNFCTWSLPEFHVMMNQVLTIVFENSTTQSYLTWGNDEQGEMRWYRSSISPVKEGETVKNVVLIVRDITETIHAEETIRESEEKRSAIIMTAMDGFSLTDLRGCFLEVNDSYCRMHGYNRQELLTMRIQDVETVESESGTIAHIQKIMDLGEDRFETCHRQKDGSVIHIEVNVQYRRVNGGQFVSFIRDITERKQAQEELRKNEERYSLIYNSSRDGIFSLDLKGKITSANRSFCEDISKEQSQVIGHTLAEIGLPEFLYQEVGNWIMQVAKTNNTVSSEIKIPMPDGSIQYYEVIVNPLHEDKNIIAGFGVSIRNITKRKETTQALIESEKRFRYLIKDMQAGVLLYGPDSELMMTNPKALKLLGIAEEKLLANSGIIKSWNAIHEDGSPFQYPEFPVPLAFATGQSVHDVILGISIPGTEEKTWLLMNAEIIYKSDGTIRNIVCSFIDISRVKRAENELKISEQRLKYHFENSPLAVVEWNKDFNITQWSIEAEHMFGWKKEEAIGKKLESLNLVYEEDIPFVYYTLEKLSSGKDDTIVSYNRNFTKLGTIIDCMWYNSILLDENGKMSSVMALVQDVTLRKQAEKALKKLNEELEYRVKERTDELSTLNEILKTAQDKYQTVADFATNWEFWIDPLDHMIYCSPSCERITGYTSVEFEDNSQLVLDIIYPDDLPAYQEHKKKEMHAHVCDHEIQYRIHKKDGSIRWIGHFCRPVYDELGNFRGIRGSNKDITARKKMEELLTTSNQKYKLLSENISDGIFICKRGKFEYANNAVYDIFGYEGHELEGLKLTKLVNTDYHEDLETFLYTNYPENESCNLEVECLKKDMTPVSVEILLNYSSKEKMVYGVLHDITEKKELQKNMLKAIIQTEEKERAHFSKELHDGLGPLLSTIKLYLQWSERPNNNKAREEIIGKAGEILEEALATVKEISNKLSPHLLTNYGLNSAIKSFVEKLNATASYNIVFESNTVRRIQVETEAALYRAVIECINNTLKYAQANNIYIRLDDTGSQIQLHYRDDGTGFDLTETLAKQKGLGLFNLQNRIHTIGGKVDLFSEQGKGVSYLFTVNL